jgi:hypothetical protein
MLDHRRSSGCVSGFRLRFGASLSIRLLGGCGPLHGSFAKWCSRIAVLFPLGSSTGGGGGLLLKIVLLACLSGDLVARMISLDHHFVRLGGFLGLEGVR